MGRLRYIMAISSFLIFVILGIVWYQCGVKESVVLDVHVSKTKANVAVLKRSLFQDADCCLEIRYGVHQGVWLDMLGCAEFIKEDDISLIVENMRREEPLFVLEGYVLGDDAMLGEVILFLKDVIEDVSLCVRVGDWLSVRYAVERVEWIKSDGDEDVLRKLTVVIYDAVDDVWLRCGEEHCARGG